MRSTNHLYECFRFGCILRKPEVHLQALLLLRAVVILAAQLLHGLFYFSEILLLLRFRACLV